VGDYLRPPGGHSAMSVPTVIAREEKIAVTHRARWAKVKAGKTARSYIWGSMKREDTSASSRNHLLNFRLSH
jgi:hypothetical protein